MAASIRAPARRQSRRRRRRPRSRRPADRLSLERPVAACVVIAAVVTGRDRTRRGKALGDGQADAAGAAGDCGDLSSSAVSHVVAFLIARLASAGMLELSRLAILAFDRLRRHRSSRQTPAVPQRTTPAAQAKPPPKATKTRLSPSSILPASLGLAERDRDRRRRGVAVAVEVDPDLVAGKVQPPRGRVDDARVRLVRDEHVDVGERQSGLADGLRPPRRP